VFLFIMLWASLGMMVFAGYSNDEEVYSAASGSGLTDPNIGFDTFAVALFTMFQVFTTSNWHEIMYRGMSTSAVPSWASPVFFITFHYFITTVVMQLMIAILVEMFIQISSDPNLTTLLSGTNAFERSSQTSSMSSRPGSARMSTQSSRNESVPTETVALGKRQNLHMSTLDDVDEPHGEPVYDDTHEEDPYMNQTSQYDDGSNVELTNLYPYHVGNSVDGDDDTLPNTLLKTHQSIIVEEDESEEFEEDEPVTRLSEHLSHQVKQTMVDKAQAIRGRSRSAAPTPQSVASTTLDLSNLSRGSRSSTIGSNQDPNEALMTRLRSGSSNVDERGRSRTSSGSSLRENSIDAQMLRSNTPRHNSSITDNSIRGFGPREKGHSGNAFGLQASSHRVRANESNFKQTASALHVLARRTDRQAFDKVDKELGEALQSGIGTLSGSGENSEVMNRVHNQRAGMGAGRRSIITMVTEDTNTFDTGRRHISMKTVGMMAMHGHAGTPKGDQTQQSHAPIKHSNSSDGPPHSGRSRSSDGPPGSTPLPPTPEQMSLLPDHGTIPTSPISATEKKPPIS